jgi:hypothetical protein
MNRSDPVLLGLLGGISPAKNAIIAMLRLLIGKPELLAWRC